MVSNYVGINQIRSKALEKNEEEGTTVIDNTNRDPFTIDDLRMNWRKYAYIAKEEGLDTLYSAMIARDPILGENYEVKYILNNKVQFDFVKTNEIEIVSYLRKELNNWGISLTLIEEAVEASRPHTSMDKYKEMAEKNPALELLRNRFKLDLEH